MKVRPLKHFKLGLSIHTNRLISIALVLLLVSCGGGSSIDSPHQPSSPIVVYDESTDGPLPYGSLSVHTASEISRVTFDIPEGTYIVRGTSSSGESFAIRLGTDVYLKEITVRFLTKIGDNDHVLFVLPYPIGSSKITNIFDMPTVGQYEFTVQAPDQSITSGTYEIYSGTSVQGGLENPFSLTLNVARKTP